MRVKLQDIDGARHEIEVDDSVEGCGAIVHRGRHYSYQSSHSVYSRPFFREVRCHRTEPRCGDAPAAVAAATRDPVVAAQRAAAQGEDGYMAVIMAQLEHCQRSRDDGAAAAIQDAKHRVSCLLNALDIYARTRSDADGDAACEQADLAWQSVERALGIAPQMPEQNAVAYLLFDSWSDVGIGMRVGLPNYDHLTASERKCITAEQMREVAEWVAKEVVVYCIRVSRPDADRRTWQWCRASDGWPELDAPLTVDERRVQSVISWPTRELAQHYLEHHMNNQGEVFALTVEELWEACRA